MTDCKGRALRKVLEQGSGSGPGGKPGRSRTKSGRFTDEMRVWLRAKRLSPSRVTTLAQLVLRATRNIG